MAYSVTLAALARSLQINPKNARAKFRALKSERPFDHTKHPTLTKPLALKAAKFLKTDYRKEA